MHTPRTSPRHASNTTLLGTTEKKRAVPKEHDEWTVENDSLLAGDGNELFKFIPSLSLRENQDEQKLFEERDLDYFEYVAIAKICCFIV